MSTDRSDFGIPKMPVISPDVATLLAYPLARRLCSIPIAATSAEITVLTAPEEDVDTLDEIRALTGRNVKPVSVPLDDIDRLLTLMSGRVDDDSLWLQHRHISALSSLTDGSLNRGHGDALRSLVDRALEFCPYSADLWLIKAKVAIHRDDAVRALAVASQIAPRDLRIVRWLQALGEGEPNVEESPAEMLPFRPASHFPAEAPPSVPLSAETSIEQRAARLAEESFRVARAIAAMTDPQEFLTACVEALQSVAGASSVSVYFPRRHSWVGYSSDAILRDRMDEALPKENKVAAQVLKQDLPVIISDTTRRRDEVGPLVARSSIRSFALVPIPGRSRGLAYINFDAPGEAASIFDPDVTRAINVVLTSAGSRAATLFSHPATVPRPVDEETDTYSMGQFRKLATTEVERARRYRFSVSLLLIQCGGALVGTGLTMQVMARIAELIRRVARASDIVAAAESDTFALLLPQTTAKAADLVGQRLQQAIADAVGLDSISVRIGSATFPDRADDAEALLKAAHDKLTRSSPQSGSSSASTAPR